MAKKKATRRTKQTTGRRVVHSGLGAWVRRYKWWLLVVAVLMVEVFVQVLYPPRYTLPFARYNHEWYGFKHRNGLAIKEQRAFAAAKVRLQASAGTSEVELAVLGASLRETDSFEALHRYPLYWRLVPFSILWQWPQVVSLPVKFDASTVQQYVQEFARAKSVAPKNAAVNIQDGRVVATAAVPGVRIDAKKMIQHITTARYDIIGATSIAVPERSVPPAATAEHLAVVREQAELTVAKQVRITVENRDDIFTPNREQIAKWLQITEVNGMPMLQLRTEAVGSYVAELNKKVARPAGETTVAMVDGRETSRQEATPGEQVNEADFISQLQSALFTPGRYKYVQAQLIAVPPSIKTTHSYSNSQAGLAAKLREFGRRYNVRISLKQLDGAGWQASYRGDESTPSASTYKLYVALRLFEELQAGRSSWESPMLDTSVAGCFDRMILHSTNQCAEAWINQFGRKQLNDYLRQRGISEVTTFVSQDATRTSADDLVRVLHGIYDGRLVNGANREKILDMLRRQIWRKGIPAGTKGWTSNKVGFLWDYVHDAGIVHHPRGTYIVAIMTKGANYGIIAQITRELEAFMYP